MVGCPLFRWHFCNLGNTGYQVSDQLLVLILLRRTKVADHEIPNSEGRDAVIRNATVLGGLVRTVLRPGHSMRLDGLGCEAAREREREGGRIDVSRPAGTLPAWRCSKNLRSFLTVLANYRYSHS